MSVPVSKEPEQSRGVGPVVWIAFLLLATVTQIAFKWGGAELEKLDFGWAWIDVAIHSPAVGIAIGGYLAMFIMWLNILQRVPLARAFAMTGLVYITVPAAAFLVFREKIGWLHAAGILLIVAGVAVMGSPDGKAPGNSDRQ